MDMRVCAMETNKETWILYKTTNLVNGKIYVGVHKVSDTKHSRRYLGSGKVLKPAIEKYGRRNFLRITLAEFDNYKDAYKAEAEMVNEDFLKRTDIYNVKLGGEGSIGFKPTEQTKRRMSIANKGRVASDEQKLNYSKAQLGNTKWLGKHHTEESKAKISAANKGHTRNTGKILTPENKAKLIASNIGRVKSKEEIEKLRIANSGANNYGSIAVVINGVYYSTRKFAAEAENVSPPTVSDRIKSPKSKWEGWRLATPEEKLSHA
jgi:group I intron endonuclease